MRTTFKTIVAATILLSFFVSAVSQQVAKSIPNSTSPDGIIGFLQFTPSDYGSQKHPLIIFLHGIGERGNGTTQLNSVTANAIPKFCAAGASMRFTANGQTSSFVVLSPQLSVQYGSWPTFYVKEMIKYAKANLQIDPNRIYVCGLSLGGGGVWDVITEATGGDYSFDGTIAAAAPVCGTQEESDANFCNTIGANHLPVWAFHSMDDGTVNVGATEHAEILASMCGNFNPAIKFTYYQSGGHGGAWIHAYDTGHITVPVVVNGVVSNFTASPNLYEWFLSNTRGTTTPVTNTAPIANAGIAQIITLPVSTVTLTGTGTGTNGAIISSYSWTKTSGPAGGTISVPLLNTTLVTGLVQGTYVYTLTVTDNHGLTNNSSVTITVNPLINTAPVANAGTAQTLTLPANTVTLTGTGTGTNGATISSYGWVKTSGPTAGSINSPVASSTTVTSLVQGTYVFTLTVTDNHGLTSSSTVTITVNPAPVAAAVTPVNKAPVANAGIAQTITLPVSTVNLNASASSDADGSIKSYLWTQTSGPAGADITSQNMVATSVTGLVAGAYTFTIQVTDNDGATASASLTITVKAAPAIVNQPSGYIKLSTGLYQACGDTSSDGRMPIYCSNFANGNKVYTDAALTNIYNGGWNWFSFTPVLDGPTTIGFSIFPDGVIHLMAPCTPTSTQPAAPASSTTLLGYIKMSVGPYQACSDASPEGRMAVYGTTIANGSYLYTDSGMTRVFNGGWNWFSFTPVLGGQVTYAFAVYPIGSILLLRDCANGGSRTVSPLENITLVQDADASSAVKLNIYPNPVHSSATITLNSADYGTRTINLYNTSGVLTAKYTWQTTKGNNTFSLKNISGLQAGLYIADIRDNNGKPVGRIKFIKD